MGIVSIFRKKEETVSCSAVIVAAGSSQRMGTDKIMAELCGVPVLARTIAAFEKSEYVDEIIVVTRQEKLDAVVELCRSNNFSKVSKVLLGGTVRTESALIGVSNVRSGAKLVAIHDGARPLVSQEIIKKTILTAKEKMAAAPVIKSVDTLKAVNENGIIIGTVDRESTMRVQTPQVFSADLIKGALTKAVSSGIVLTDDCSAMEMMGIKTYTVEGSEDNIKLTTPRDMFLAEFILRDRGEL